MPMMLTMKTRAEPVLVDNCNDQYSRIRLSCLPIEICTEALKHASSYKRILLILLRAGIVFVFRSLDKRITEAR